MHSRILHRLSDAASGSECAVGSYCLSYNSSCDDNLENLVIYGKANTISSPLGTLDQSTGKYNIKVRIHGINLIDGFDFFEAMATMYSSYIECMFDEDSYFQYRYDYADEYANIIGSNPKLFKENTVYTFRFHFIGQRNSSTGIQICYTDSSSEDIMSGDSDDCYIAYTSVEGKTISEIKLSQIPTADYYRIEVLSFGIFEGAHDYDYFDYYRGYEYTISMSNPLCGHTVGGVGIYDTFDWKNKSSTIRIMRTTFTRDKAFFAEIPSDPQIIQLHLPVPADMNRPMDLFYTYPRKDSVEDIIGVEYAYTLVDESTVYFSPYFGIYTASQAFSYPKSIVYARAEKLYVKENSCIDIPRVAKGYVGIEVYGSGVPNKLLAYYKK